MIQKGKDIEKFLNLLLVFLLPTQLALHFWPKFALVFGIRVDYLAPTIYLTDILFIGLFVYWTIKSGRNDIGKFLKKNLLFAIAILLISLTNIIFSSFPALSLLKWLKLIEVALFAYYVWARSDLFNKKSFLMTLFYSMVFFSLIGIFQVILKGTLDGPFYYLGERSFNISTPGIALGKIGETIFLRAYSTFPHPNALAGYLVVSMFVLLGTVFIKTKWIKITGFIIILSAYVLSFSLSSLVGLTVCIFVYLIYKKGGLNKKILPIIIFSLFGLSLIFAVLSKPLIQTGINFSESIGQRLELADISGKIISANFLIGTGLNTFIPNEVKFPIGNSYMWLLQPVHNIYLLVISETGIIGGLFLYFLILKITQKASNNKKPYYFLAIIFILVTVLFDHYWFTLQQNLLLLGLLIGKTLSAES